MRKILFTFLILSFVSTGCFLKKSPVVNDASKKQEDKQVEKNQKAGQEISEVKEKNNNYYNDDTVAKRDMRRVGWVQTIRTGLELYYNDAGRYPDMISNSLSYNGVTYMPNVPKAPEPPDGNCSEEENQFIYKPTNNNSSYILSYCLGEEYEISDEKILKAGVQTAVPENFPKY